MRYSIETLPKILIDLIKTNLELVGMYNDENKEQVWSYRFKSGDEIHIAETYFIITDLPF